MTNTEHSKLYRFITKIIIQIVGAALKVNSEKEFYLVHHHDIRKNKQLIVDKITGDCFRACITSLLGIPNGDYLPTAGDVEWFSKYHKFLRKFGLTFKWEPKAFWQQGYWIACVPSLNFPYCNHAILMKDHLVFHDPTTSNNKYQSGRPLLGESIVNGGYIFMVEDMSKLHKLRILRDKMYAK